MKLSRFFGAVGLIVILAGLAYVSLVRNPETGVAPTSRVAAQAPAPETPLSVSPSSGPSPVAQESAAPTAAAGLKAGKDSTAGPSSASGHAALSATEQVAGAQATSLGEPGTPSGPPTADQVRAEVAKNPEAPSKAVLGFSVGMEKKMEVALQSEESASELFTDLDHCASNSGKLQVAESARSLCLSNASRLADKYPDLKPRYENLETRTDPGVVKMKKLMDIK